MKFLLNPYVVGLEILLVEASTNFLVHSLFDIEMGQRNLSIVVWFIIAGFVVGKIKKEMVPKSFGAKVTLTYFLLVASIIAIGFGSLIMAPFLLGIMTFFFSIVGFVCYWLFMFAMKKTVESQNRE